MSPVRVTDQLSAGMITDVMVPGGLQYMQDAYLRRSGEICTRGPIFGDEGSSPAFASGITGGVSQVAFHPDFGSLMCSVFSNNGGSVSDIDDTSGYADGFRFCGAPHQTTLVDSSPVFEWAGLGTGTYENQIDIAATGTTTYLAEKCNSNAVMNREIIMAGENGRLFRWGGSTKDMWSTGTVAYASDSRTITGTGTSWAANVEAGMYMLLDDVVSAPSGASAENGGFLITRVVDDTTLEIEYPLSSSGTGKSYKAVPMCLAQSPDGVWNETDESPRTIGVCASHQGRLFVGGPSDNETEYNTVYNFNRIRWSGNQTEIDPDYPNHRGVNLWSDAGYLDIYPGVGGVIRGLVSMGNELVIIKSNGMFRLVGTVGYDGTEASPVSLQVISHSIGAAGVNAWAMTKNGLVVAHRSGLYIYDGDGLKSLTSGRVNNWWAYNYRHYTFDVNAFSDKVVVNRHRPNNGLTDEPCLVWQMDHDYMWIMTYPDGTPTVGFSGFTAADEWVGDFLYPGKAHNSSSSEVTDVSIHHTTYKSSNLNPTNTTSDLAGDGPQTYVVTHPIPLGDSQWSEGRPNNVFAHIACEGSSPAQVKLFLGSTHKFLSAAEDDTLEADLQYGSVATEYIPPNSELPRDRIWRVPVHSGTPQSPSCSIQVTAGENSRLRLYMLGVDFTSSDTNIASVEESY